MKLLFVKINVTVGEPDGLGLSWMTGSANDYLYAGMRTESGYYMRIKLSLPALTESSIQGKFISTTDIKVFHSSYYNRDFGDHITVTTRKIIIFILFNASSQIFLKMPQWLRIKLFLRCAFCFDF